ncbi:MAG: hypothetical protein GX556_07260 [Fibrobacter sp.]|nr:hypothetical protein [Fibrobacter sp.]
MKHLFIALFLTAVLIPGCKQKNESGKNNPAPQVQEETKPINFVPPSDSTISANQIKVWLTCNPLLDSLTIMYSDSFKTEDPAKRMRFQEVFSSAQDRICVKAGLAGGYKEYKWIMNSMGNPKNKPALDSTKLAVY